MSQKHMCVGEGARGVIEG